MASSVRGIPGIAALPRPTSVQVSYPKEWSAEEAFDMSSSGLTSAAGKMWNEALASAGGSLTASYFRDQGKSINAKEKILFKNLPFRQVQFTWNLTPLSEEEFNDYHEFIENMKYWSAPIEDGSFWLYPDLFDLTIQSGVVIFKSKDMACTSVDVDWTPLGTWAVSGSNRNPTSFTLSLSFMETVYAHQEALNGGEIV